MKNLYALIAILILFCSCKSPAGYTITGNVTGLPDSTMIRLRIIATQEDIDSALVIDGKFLLKGRLADVPEELALHTDHTDDYYLYASMLIGNENVTALGDASGVKISGSKFNDEYNDLYLGLMPLKVTRDSLAFYVKVMSVYKPEIVDAIREEFAVADESCRTACLERLESKLDTYAGIMSLGLHKESFPKEELRALYDRIPAENKNNRFAREIGIYLDSKISEVGDMCHDFEAVDQDGNTVKFHDLLDGRYILLDFTSYGCGACVQSIPELRMVNEKYSDSLRIVSFACDAKREWWLMALERDKPTWPYLWNGESLSGEVCLKYGVRAQPTFFIIDPEGMIIHIWSGYGNADDSRGIVEYFLDKHNVPSNKV